MCDFVMCVYLHTYFHERLKKNITHTLHHKQPLSILLVHIDNYDKIVHTHGPLENNHILHNMAHTISNIISIDDMLTRYDTDRFVLLTHTTELATGMELADRMKKTAASVRPVDDGAAIVPAVTVGVGCSS